MTVASLPSTDLHLLREHRAGSRDAFTDLVHRHVNLVYSAALRQVRDTHLADDVTQAVFLLLWQKAALLNESTILPAWLHRTTRYCAANALRLRTIRQRHETRVAEMSPHQTNPRPAQSAEEAELAQVLDKAVAKLPSADRAAVIMRYFEGKSAEDVAAALHVTPDAARKRIERAVAKLQTILARLGVTTATPALAAFLARQCIVTSPAHVVTSITNTIAAASAGSTASAGAAGAIAKGALVAMTVKAKLTTAAIVAALLLAGAIGAYVYVTHTQPAPVARAATPIARAALAPRPAGVIRVQAYIDGRSRLQIHGNTAQWLNLEFNVPGTHGNTLRPTLINDRKWFPTWLNAPIGNRSLSDPFELVEPALPGVAGRATVTPITARGAVKIVQQPAADNEYTLVIEFDDSIEAGAADYAVDIAFAPAASTLPVAKR